MNTSVRCYQRSGTAESFVNTFKRDYLTRMDLHGAREVLEQLPAAFQHLNELHLLFSGKCTRCKSSGQRAVWVDKVLIANSAEPRREYEGRYHLD